MKRQYTEYENMFADTHDKGYYPKLIKHLQNQHQKNPKQNNQKNGQRT